MSFSFPVICMTVIFFLMLGACTGLKYADMENAYRLSKTVDESSSIREVVVTEETVAETPSSNKQPAASTESITVSEEPSAASETTPETLHEVKQGECLWWIAQFEDIYNDPLLWPLIYSANKDKIKNPHLIYPGQVLTIPRTGISEKQIEEARKTAKSTRPYLKINR